MILISFKLTRKFASAEDVKNVRWDDWTLHI
jgi:hypothetical protein